MELFEEEKDIDTEKKRLAKVPDDLDCK